MSQICLYLQLHQPLRLGDFDLFDLNSQNSYFESKKNHNQKIFQKVANKSYIPMLELLLYLTKAHHNFKFALSASGIFLEQALVYEPEIIKLLQKLAATGQVEFLAETYYHSLASLYSQAEFEFQVDKHKKIIKKLFKITPQVFRNTELIYSNQIAELVGKLNFVGMLTEAVPRYLGQESKTRIYKSTSKKFLPLLLKHAELSDDVAFRFSDKNWPDYPIHADRYFSWLKRYGEKEIINLFMDFETFGEHQWADTGIFEFFAELIKQISQSEMSSFKTPSELFEACHSVRQLADSESPGDLNKGILKRVQDDKVVKNNFPIYDVPEPISWADIDRDLTAWLANDLQQDSITKLYSLESKIKKSRNQKLLEDWRKLQCSDHFYYMCTKWAADGDVHAYFSPYDSPLEAYRKYSIVLADLVGRIYDK